MASPEFIERDLQTIINDMIADYEQRTGRVLYPGQVERLLINSFAYREQLIRERIQYAATQNLVDFANAPVLDYLGALLGVERLAASKASCIIRFNLVPGHSGVTIPQGTRVGSSDGQVVFQTLSDEVVPVGTNTVDLTTECLNEGSSGNGLIANTLTNLLDPQPFISSVTNTSETGGGAEQETDVELRERIKLAPGSFSNAGSRGAYAYFAKSANPSIIDVAVIGPNDGVSGVGPGEVHIFPLMADGSTTPTTVLNEVDAVCNDEKIRPLTDEVIVTSPTQTPYDIEVDLTLYTDADPTSTQAAVEAALNEYALAKRQTLGQDIKLTQIIGRSSISGVYDVSVVSPSSDIIITPTEFGFCNSVTVNVIGTNNG